MGWQARPRHAGGERGSVERLQEKYLLIYPCVGYSASKSFFTMAMNGQDELDTYSRGLLLELMRDARQTVQQLADAVGLSASPCWKRIKAMEERGVIRGYSARVDPEKVGLGLQVIVEANLARHREDQVRSFEDEIAAIPEIVQCLSTTGESDYVMTVMVADIKGFERFLHDTLLRLPGITHVRSRIVLRELKAQTQLPLAAPAAAVRRQRQGRPGRAERLPRGS